MDRWLVTIIVAYLTVGFILYITGYMDHQNRREQWEKDHPGMNWEDWNKYRK